MYGFTPQLFSVKGMANLESQQAYGAGVLTEAELAKREAAAAVVNEAGAALADAEVSNAINKGQTPSGLGAFFTFELHQLEETINDEAEDFPTILQVDGGMAFEQGNVGGTDESYSNLRAYVYSPVLVSRFGVIAEQMSIPFAGQKSQDQSRGANGPLAKRMAKLALIEYMKRMADASTWDGSVVFRPFLFPNRPVWLKRSARIGLLTSVTNRWSVGKSASTTMSMNMLMAERFDSNSETEIQTQYRLTTGASNTPISYKNLWDDDYKGEPKSGVQVEVGTKEPAKPSSNGSAGSTGSGTPTPAASADKSPFAPLADDNLYPPFLKAINLALEKAKNEGLPKITIKSKYRSPAKQLDLKEHPEKRAKKANGESVEAAEPWKSSHQYGMAIDISIQGNRHADYQKFAELCGTNILWGAVYKDDYVHYEWNVPGGAGRQANLIAKQLGYDDSTIEDVGEFKESLFLEDVWKKFDSIKGVADYGTKVSSDTPKGSKSPTGDVGKSEKCTPAYLKEGGIASMKEIAEMIARAQFS